MPEDAINPPENKTWLEKVNHLVLKKATREGYNFDGWLDKAEGGNKIDDKLV
ncbi:MAG: InlB B-repeat-containing protein [Bacilli bacterium]|nr:InlB B-repeat-containing protein [Bacilli bacterium]